MPATLPHVRCLRPDVLPTHGKLICLRHRDLHGESDLRASLQRHRARTFAELRRSSKCMQRERQLWLSLVRRLRGKRELYDVERAGTRCPLSGMRLMEPSTAELAKRAMLVLSPRMVTTRKLSVLTALLLMGCSGTGSTATGHGGTGGFDAAGGSQSTGGGSDTGGAAGGSGAGGSGNAGGSNTGGTGGGTSPGKVTIEFTVAGGSFCMTSQCGEGPSVDIEGSALDRTCTAFSCQTCQPTYVGPGCGASQCPAAAEGIAVVGGGLSWDGTYYPSSTCTLNQTQVSCVEPAFAKPGKYTAEFCATPGTLSGPDGGPRKCVASGPLKCSTIDFDFPSSATVKGTLGP